MATKKTATKKTATKKTATKKKVAKSAPVTADVEVAPAYTAWTPADMPVGGKSNSTEQLNDHPTEHNHTASAVSDIVDRFADLRLYVPGVNSCGIAGDLKVDGKLTVKSDGGASNPAIAFDGIDGMGIYASSTSNYIRFGVSGAQRLGIKEDVVVVNTDLQVDGQIKTTAGGSKEAPAFQIGPDKALGMFGSIASQYIRFAADGEYRLQVGTSKTTVYQDLQVDGQTLAQNGTKAAPAYSFVNDPDTGLYREAADVLELVVGGERAIQVGKTGSSLDGFWAPGVYRKTTTERYNVTVGGDGGHLVRSTASRSALQQIEPVHRAAVHSVLELEPIWYRSKCENDNPNLSQYGFAAEDVAAIDPRLATNVEDANGNLVPDNVDVVAIAALLVGVVKEQHQQISDLTARVEALEAAS